MRKPMKIAALLLAACLACLGLTGCHGDRGLSAFSMPDAFDESRDYEITFWAKNDTNKTQVAVYQQAIADFEKAYPNIHVNLRLYTNYGDIYNDVITNIATGTTPNVCITYPDHIATYLTGSNVVAPLDKLMDDDAIGLGGTQVKFAFPFPGGNCAPVFAGGLLRRPRVRHALHALHRGHVCERGLCGTAGL